MNVGVFWMPEVVAPSSLYNRGISSAESDFAYARIASIAGRSRARQETSDPAGERSKFLQILSRGA
jgi:hypothetical protein